jgi:hypothetical protein
LLIYAVCWYLPHREEITRVSRYYLHAQLLPHSLIDLQNNIGTALFGPRPGLLPFLLLHMPVLFLLAVGFTWAEHKTAHDNPTARYLMGWFWIPICLFAVVSYAPSRYYVLFYPAMAGLAALGWERLWEAKREIPSVIRRNLHAPALTLLLWAVVNGAWLGDWLIHIRYSQRDADRWLAQNLPQGSVLLGDAAPGLAVSNAFKAITVIPGLSNNKEPVERFAPAPRYIVILNGQKNVNWWRERYPAIITPENLIRLFPRLVDFEVAVYLVPESCASL